MQEHSRERGRADGGGAGRGAAGREDSQETYRIAQEKQVNRLCMWLGYLGLCENTIDYLFSFFFFNHMHCNVVQWSSALTVQSMSRHTPMHAANDVY